MLATAAGESRLITTLCAPVYGPLDWVKRYSASTIKDVAAGPEVPRAGRKLIDPAGAGAPSIVIRPCTAFRDGDSLEPQPVIKMTAMARRQRCVLCVNGGFNKASLAALREGKRPVCLAIGRAPEGTMLHCAAVAFRSCCIVHRCGASIMDRTGQSGAKQPEAEGDRRYKSFNRRTASRARFRNSVFGSPASRKIGGPMVMQLNSGTGRNSPRGRIRLTLSI